MEYRKWYLFTQEETLKLLNSQVSGLSGKEAAKRLETFGPNKLEEQSKISPWQIFLSQFKDFMVLVLIGATLISGMLGEYADAITILIIVIVNAILGFIQEYRAEQSMEALQRLTAPEATVVRDRSESRIPARDLVPGDIVLLEAGDRIPADGRLVEAISLEVEESALTGESRPVKKQIQSLPDKDLTVGDRSNMVFMGTVVTRGRGKAVITNTAMDTEMGKIAGMIQEVQGEQTPLQRRLGQMGNWLVWGCLIICAVVVAVGILRGEAIYRMFLAGVSLAVAAIPEGLPAVVTISLAIGVQRMIKRKAIIRKLPAVETLGCATVICSDKTGTLTANEMTVRKIFLEGREIEVEGQGYQPLGNFICQGQGFSSPALQTLLKAAALCNNAGLTRDGLQLDGLFRGQVSGQWGISGDPTEGALLVMAAKGGIWREVVETEEQRLQELPFDSERKRMTTVYRDRNQRNWAYTKGAPDLVMNLCSKVLWQGEVVPLTSKLKEVIFRQNEKMAGQALRVLALAYRELGGAVDLVMPETVEQDLIFLGLAGMQDPPRPAAIRAIETCKLAGIKPVMITGDHQVTALAIAKELNLADSGEMVLTGAELDGIDDGELERKLDKVAVFARVSPKHKLRIVRAFKNRGHVVAMTGDGVNDAPAVKEADIGIAMGQTGTDVTKEASAMILGDDNFATIVAAMEEGRSIYDNIRKFIRYLLACNLGEILVMFLAIVFNLPLPLLPIQILWVNLVTDGLPAMALGVDQADPDIMLRKPRHSRESIFARGLGRAIANQGIQIGLGTLLVFVLALYLGEGDEVTARTMAFATLVFFQLFYVFECRSERYDLFQVGVFSNVLLVFAVLTSVAMQLAVIYLPVLQPVFKTVPLNWFQWLIVLVISGGHAGLLGIRSSILAPSRRSPVFQR